MADEITDEVQDQVDDELEAKFAASRERYRERLAYDTDFDLDLLLDLVFGFDDEGADASVGLTLVTPGGIIEGTVVHQSVYAESQIQSTVDASEKMANFLRIVQEKRVESLEKRKAVRDADEPTPQRQYIHFTEATVTNGNYRTTLPNAKVSLTSVIAWSLGYRTHEE